MPLMSAWVDLTKPLHLVFDDVLSPEECGALIDRIEAAGPTVAPITRAQGAVLDLETRNNSRVMFDDPEYAALLFERIATRVPQEMRGMRVVGANERLRCYKYEPGQAFKPHYDGAFVRSKKERSLLTYIVYLNEGFSGGETALLDLGLSIQPKTGRALLFQHMLLHEGCEVVSGVKYAVRSDIMYSGDERDP